MENKHLALTIPIVSWVIIELCYFAYVKVLVAPKLNPRKKAQEPLFGEPIDLVSYAYDTIEKIENYSFKSFVSGFFMNAPFEEIGGSNFDSFLSWAVYTDAFDNLSEQSQSIIQKLRKDTADRFNVTWKEGYTATINHIKGDLEDLTYIHFPLAYYALVATLELWVEIKHLRYAGFKRFWIDKTISYWIRTNENATHPPVIIFHGICSGWSNFVDLIEKLSVDRTVILYNYDCIKRQSMVFEVPTAIDVANSVATILNNHHIQKVSIIGVSWGTILAGWVARLQSDRIVHMSLIDPVTLAICLPDTIYTLLYKPNEVFYDYLLHYFVRRDLTIANALCRNVAWYNVLLDLSKISDDISISVGISKKDHLINTDVVTKMTELCALSRLEQNKKPIKIMVWDDVYHSDSILYNECLDEMVHELNLHL